MLVDEYEVELLKKLPKYHRKIYDFQQIAKAQTPEIESLLVAVNFVLDSWFAETATEYGISRMEKTAGLTPDPTDNLETRGFKLLTKMSEKTPYTDLTMKERLASLCGEDNYSIVRDYVNYLIAVDTDLGVMGAFDEVCNAMVKMLPCNLVLTITNTLKANKCTPAYVGVGVCKAFHYIITSDINVRDGVQMDLRGAIGVSFADTGVITSDINVKNTSSMSVNGGIGVSVGNTRIITNDIKKTDTINGNSTVANPVSTARVITIN